MIQFPLNSMQMHLFDIDIPGGITFQESKVLSPGEEFFSFDTGELECQFSSRTRGCGAICYMTCLTIILQTGARLALGSATTCDFRKWPPFTTRKVLCSCSSRANDNLCISIGCKLLVYPGAFNMTTGPVHWELLAKGRYC